MAKHKSHLAAFAVFLLAATGAQGAGEKQDLVGHVIEACKPEIENYCGQVTPGGGRLLACFYAHQDKLSGRCEYALYDASAQLEEFAAATVYLAKACQEDMQKLCSRVQLGEGRVGMCLLENRSEVSKGCSDAMDDVGLEVVEE